MANTNPRRGRVFIRNTGTATGDWRHDRPDRGQSYMLVGVLEIGEDDRWQREAILDFSLLGALAAFEDTPRPLDPVCSACDLPSAAAHHAEFRRASDIATALGWGSGGMILRDTRAPSAPGMKTVFMVMGLCLPTAALPDAHMADVMVDGTYDRPSRARINVTEPCPLVTNGLGINQVAKLPLWGWDQESYGFRSLMRLDVVDACTKLQRMTLDGDGDPAEMERLRQFTQGAIQMTDPVYMRFLRHLDKDGHVRAWDETPTADEMRSREEMCDQLVRSLLENA